MVVEVGYMKAYSSLYATGLGHTLRVNSLMCLLLARNSQLKDMWFN